MRRNKKQDNSECQLIKIMGNKLRDFRGFRGTMLISIIFSFFAYYFLLFYANLIRTFVSKNIFSPRILLFFLLFLLEFETVFLFFKHRSQVFFSRFFDRCSNLNRRSCLHFSSKSAPIFVHGFLLFFLFYLIGTLFEMF